MVHRQFEIDPDIRKAHTLPAAVYSDPAVFEAQKRTVFARSWQLAADLESVRVPGQVVPVTLLDGLLDEPLLFTRDADDRLHCLSNVCTHRGTVLVDGACNEKSIRCRYHGRRFGLDGAFQYMPEFEGAIGFPSPADNLPRIPFGTWGPILFVSLDPESSLEDVLKPVSDRIGMLPLQALRPEPARSREYLVRANWALYCDNYLEGLHIPFVHAALNAAIDQSSYSTELFDSATLQLAIARPGEECFNLPESSPDHGRRVAAYYFWIFPNTMLNFYPWGLSANVVKPLAPDRTRVSYITWIWDESRLDRGAGSGLDRVEREDEAVVEAVQRGIQSASYVRGRYSPSRETGVHHFHRLLAARL